MAKVSGFIGFSQYHHEVCNGGATMSVTSLVLHPDGLLGLFELPRVSCLMGGPFDVGHGYYGDDILFWTMMP